MKNKKGKWVFVKGNGKYDFEVHTTAFANTLPDEPKN